MFDNEMRRVNTFIPMDSEVVESKKEIEESSKGVEDELEADKSKKAESSEKKAKGSRKKMLGRKRAGKEQQQESSKRQRMEDDKETDEHEEVEEDDEAELKKHLMEVQEYSSLIIMLQGYRHRRFGTLVSCTKVYALLDYQQARKTTTGYAQKDKDD
ncbi:hypothetical protein Tco_0825442 [Tanacetum coccineum]